MVKSDIYYLMNNITLGNAPWINPLTKFSTDTNGRNFYIIFRSGLILNGSYGRPIVQKKKKDGMDRIITSLEW